MEIRPDELREAIFAVRDSSLTNMLDVTAVAKIMTTMGYDEASEWVLKNRREYSKLIMLGFEDE